MEIRPRFSDHVPVEKANMMQLFKDRLSETEEVKAAVWEHHIILKMPPEEQHYWSPQITISFEWEEDGVLIRGLCGPRPAVWMMFVFFYFLLGFFATIVMIMGFAQMNLGLSAGILWLLPVIGVVIGLVYLTAHFGQKFAKDEMRKLYSFYMETKAMAVKDVKEEVA